MKFKKVLMALSCSGVLSILLALSSTTTQSATRYWQFYSQTGSGFNTVCHFRRPILNSNGQPTGQYEYYNITTNPIIKSCTSFIDSLPN